MQSEAYWMTHDAPLQRWEGRQNTARYAEYMALKWAMTGHVRTSVVDITLAGDTAVMKDAHGKIIASFNPAYVRVCMADILAQTRDTLPMFADMVARKTSVFGKQSRKHKRTGIVVKEGL